MTAPAQLEPNKLYIGDAFDGLPRIAPESARLVLSDPPYLVSRPNNLTTMRRTGIDFDWDKTFDRVGWLPLAAEALMPGGSIVIWDDWKKLGILAEALTALGFDVKRQLLWLKDNPFPRNRDRSFVQAHEMALWAVKTSNKKKWVFHRRAGRGFETGVFRYPIPRTKKGQPRHPAAKPVAMFSEIIEVLTNPGDLVVDPFSGNWTTALAAQAANRRYICIEKDGQWSASAPQPTETL